MKDKYLIYMPEINAWVLYNPAGTAYFEDDIKDATQFISRFAAEDALLKCSLNKDAFLIMHVI